MVTKRRHGGRRKCAQKGKERTQKYQTLLELWLNQNHADICCCFLSARRIQTLAAYISKASFSVIPTLFSHPWTQVSAWLSLECPNVRPYGNTTATQEIGIHTLKTSNWHTIQQGISFKCAVQNKRSKTKGRCLSERMVTYVHLPMCVCVFACQGRSALLALDSTCCYWTHWAQLALQSVCVCGRERERERDIVLLCVTAFISSLSVSLCICFIVLCRSVSSYWQLYSAAVVCPSHKRAHTSMQGPL